MRLYRIAEPTGQADAGQDEPQNAMANRTIGRDPSQCTDRRVFPWSLYQPDPVPRASDGRPMWVSRAHP